MVNDIDLAEIENYLPHDPVIIEAGAMDGSDTIAMAARWPGARIFAFEPLPLNFEVLKRRTASLTKIEALPQAVAAITGTATLQVAAPQTPGAPSTSSSLLIPKEHLSTMPDTNFNSQILVQTVNLDDWCVSRQVDVDFAWLDLQGMELPALQSSPVFTSRLRAAVLEVSRSQLYVGMSTYNEVVDWMETQGMRVAIDRVARISGNMLFVR